MKKGTNDAFDLLDADLLKAMSLKTGHNFAGFLGTMKTKTRRKKGDWKILQKYLDSVFPEPSGKCDIEYFARIFNKKASEDLSSWLGKTCSIPCKEKSFCWRCHQTDAYYIVRYLEDVYSECRDEKKEK